MGLFRGAVFRHGGPARKQPIKQPTEMPTSTHGLNGPFPLVNGPFSDLNRAFPRFPPKGPFYLFENPLENSPEIWGHYGNRGLTIILSFDVVPLRPYGCMAEPSPLLYKRKTRT